VSPPPEPPDQGGTWISSGQIYAELRRIGDEVVQLRLQFTEVSQLRSEVTQVRDDLDALRVEMEAVKARRWPLPTVGVMTGLAAAVISLVALFES
jgi:uncharacterized membrane protein YjjP (DUF1212 family)